MAKILVTGGAGFIGSHLCERLLARGHEVVVLDDFSSGKRANLAHVEHRLRIIESDVVHVSRHIEALRGVKRVYHLAALISGYDSLGDPDAYLRTNIQGLLRLLEVCRELDRPRVVFASSSTVYGDGAVATRSEATAPAPITMYALTKLMGEHTLAMYAALYGYEHVSLRLFNVYGPRQSPDHPYANVTCKFAHAAATGASVKLYGDGSQSRDFVYVDDVVDALERVGDPTPRRLYNVGTGVDNSIRHLLELVQEITGKRLDVVQHPPWPNDIRAIRADISRLTDETGLRPRTELRRGLEQTIAWFGPCDG